MAAPLALDVPRAAALFHALSDPVRLEVIELLLDGERCVCELTDALDTGQSRLSWHLKTLKDAGVVTDRREGRWVYYALALDSIAEARDVLAAIKSSARRTAGRAACCD
jgi:ArsR family transcriptional regulator